MENTIKLKDFYLQYQIYGLDTIHDIYLLAIKNHEFYLLITKETMKSDNTQSYNNFLNEIENFIFDSGYYGF